MTAVMLPQLVPAATGAPLPLFLEDGMYEKEVPLEDVGAFFPPLYRLESLDDLPPNVR